MGIYNYYIYYDPKTGEIQSISNEIDKNYKAGIQVDFDEISGFLDGKMRMFDYKIGYKKLPNKDVVLGIVHKDSNGYSFKNNVFEWIKENNNEADCLVTWDGKKKTWTFQLNDHVKKFINIVLQERAVFFVILEEDFDFLVRTISVRLGELLENDTVEVPFSSELEHDFDKIAIASRMMFKSYGLRIIHE